MLKDKWVWVLVVMLVIYADQVTKLNALARLTEGHSMTVFKGLKFQLAYNTGAAFSLLSNNLTWQRWFLKAFSIAMSLGLVVWLKNLSQQKHLEGLGLSLILGGALGNLWDRFVFGYVVDFISVYYKDYYWPTFNIADSAICLGAAFVLVASLHTPKKIVISPH